MMKPSIKQAVLRVLSDGQWHTRTSIMQAWELYGFRSPYDLPMYSFRNRVSEINLKYRKLTGQDFIEYRDSGVFKPGMYRIIGDRDYINMLGGGTAVPKQIARNTDRSRIPEQDLLFQMPRKTYQ